MTGGGRPRHARQPVAVAVARSAIKGARSLSATLPGATRAVLAQSRAFPFATNLSLVSIPIGLLALVVGPRVSAGFTVVFHRPEPVYVWGVVLLLGGVNVARGIVSHVPSRERAGLYVLASAWATYGASVIIGLGFGGLVTGPICLVLALSAVQRGRMILRTARTIAAVAEITGVPIVSDIHTGGIAPAPSLPGPSGPD